jgi:hypothetical protein
MTKRAREFTEMRTLLTSRPSLNMVLKIPGVKLCGMALAAYWTSDQTTLFE